MSPQKYRLVRRAEKLEQTRRRIISAAAELYREQGVRGTSLAQVARRADVAPTTVLNHFGDGEALIAAVADHTLQSLAFPDQSVLIGARGPAERVRALMEALFGFWERGESWFYALGEDLQEIPALVAAERDFWSKAEVLYAAVFGPALGDRVSRAAIMVLSGPATFGELRAAGLNREEAAALVSGLLVRFAGEAGTEES